jgi:adenylate cyclase
MKMSFSARLSWQTAVILAATMLVVFAYTWMRAQAILSDVTERVIKQTAEQIDDQVATLFDRTEQRARLLAGLAGPTSSFSDAPLDRTRFNELATQMLQLMNVSPEVNTLCVVVDDTGEYVRAVRLFGGSVVLDTGVRSPSGTLVRTTIDRSAGLLMLGAIDPLPQKDVREEAFYKSTLDKGELYWTPTHEIKLPGEAVTPGVTCAVPINPSGVEPVGIAYAELTLTSLSRYVSQIDVGELGYAFLIDRPPSGTARIIAYKDPSRLLSSEGESVRLVTVGELGDEVVSRSFGLNESLPLLAFDETRRLRLKVDGQDQLAGFRRIGGEPRPEWLLGIVVPAEEFMGNLVADRNVLAMFAVIAMLAGIYVSLLLAQRIAGPVRQIVGETKRIRSLDFSARPLPSTHVIELEELAVAVEQLKTSLRSFEKLVPAQYARHLVTTGQEARLGGERKRITIYFADIVGFTRLSEMMPPEELVEVLAEYLDVLSGQVIDHDGTVDKFNGDDVMAFWGAPSPVDNPALRACESAVRSQEALRALHISWGELGKPCLTASFGIATGDVIVGNVGSRARMNYTVIGDAANLASRLQGLNKFYETAILIGEQTMLEAGDAVLTRLVDYVAVAGREHSVPVYELMGMREECTPDDVRIAAVHDGAMARYRERQFVEAADGFRTVVAMREKDGPARILLKRCLAYIENPPTEDWDGSYRAMEK